MKIFYYFVFVLVLSACSVTTEESTTSSGSSDGTASAPVELTVGTEKTGSVTFANDSFYKFTTASTGAGSYELGIGSFSSSTSVSTYLYSDSGYSTMIDWGNGCLASCIEYFYYMAFDASTTYYLRIYGYGAVTYSLTVSQGGSEGSKNNPVALTLGTAHPGSVEGTSSYGKSYYKFTTSSADNYTLSMNNSDSLDCFLFTNSVYWVWGGGSSYVSDTHNGCTIGENLSTTFKGSSGAGLTANTTYYLMIEQRGATALTTTYDNMTVAPEG